VGLNPVFLTGPDFVGACAEAEEHRYTDQNLRVCVPVVCVVAGMPEAVPRTQHLRDDSDEDAAKPSNMRLTIGHR
jgi:hypothetical protein